MRFLDLDLDFFLNDSAYRSERESGRLSSEYKPWSASMVRRFLEERCGLSLDVPIQGRTVESHEGVFDFWRMLIKSGGLRIPFEVIHIDAHPDLWAGGGLYLASGFLHVDSEHGPAMLKKKHIHSGNYLTFAIARGWIASLVWVPLRKYLRGLPKWDADARSILIQLKKRKGEGSSIRDLPAIEREPGVPFKIIPWHKFRTREAFDYIALSRSPSFTPPESDKLIPIIEEYMRQI
jgi:hypothetical protein